ncbi:MAG TPA: hypothetical protein VLA78_05605 [Paracoccaceae bacterium]|nr:hypothetical protein [Paracoccaceae bacterium]
MFSRRISAALLLSAALALPATAEPLSPVQTAALSARLYDAGVQAGDPVLILAAARLRKTIAPEAAPGRAADGGEAGTDAPLTWEAMLATAEALSEGDEVMAGLYDDLRAETTKGVVSGPVYNIGSLGRGKRDTYGRIDFKGGEYAEVYVEAQSSVDLNLTVVDAQGRLVCADTDISHIAYCGWRPDAAGAFTLIVDNKGAAATGYALMTN